MAVKHLVEGSVKPNLKENDIYLFSMRFCPYAHRVHLVLNAKNIKYDPIYINLVSKPKWYLELVPMGRVPGLFYKGQILCESLLVADFINEEFPENSLYPVEPIKKYTDKILLENFNKISSAFYKNAMVEFSKQNFEDLLKCLDEFELELYKRKTNYFGGCNKPHMVDYMIWPWFERMEALPVLYGSEAQIPVDRFPNLIKWISIIKNDSAVQKHYLSPEQHAKHFTLRKMNDSDAFDNII
ncbi:hypothetical protein PGB90_007409 [Kerria lacca]